MPDMSTAAYFWRFLKIASPFALQLALSVVCVVSSQFIQLMVPHTQGSIINALIDSDRTRFKSALSFLITLSVLSAVVGSLQGLAVQRVARQMSLSLRAQMFRTPGLRLLCVALLRLYYFGCPAALVFCFLIWEPCQVLFASSRLMVQCRV